MNHSGKKNEDACDECGIRTTGVLGDVQVPSGTTNCHHCGARLSSV